MKMHKALETLNMDTVEFNPEFLRIIRPICHEQFKQMSLEYDPSDRKDFKCDKMLLTSLEGAPQSVDRHFSCNNNPHLSNEQIDHYIEFLNGKHQECLVDGHYMPPENLK